MVDFQLGDSKRIIPAASTGVEREAVLGQADDSPSDLARQYTHQSGGRDAVERGANITQELYLLFRNMLRGSKGWPILRLTIAIMVVLVGNMFGQVRPNEWNGVLFDAVEKRNSTAFINQLGVFSSSSQSC